MYFLNEVDTKELQYPNASHGLKMIILWKLLFEIEMCVGGSGGWAMESERPGHGS